MNIHSLMVYSKPITLAQFGSKSQDLPRARAVCSIRRPTLRIRVFEYR
jgi:hypothetical protein